MDPIRLLGMRTSPLRVDEVCQAVADPASGGAALFLGTVRDVDHGRAVVELEYSAHPSAEEELRAIATAVIAQYPVRALAALHRVGALSIGELSVVVAVACPHRTEAFAACQRFVEELKGSVPIWKRQRFAAGEHEWVGLDC